MPQSNFTEKMLAACGMNCAVCYKHLGKNPCQGCNGASKTKPEHCRKCRIKDCGVAKGVRHCLDCDLFPCKYIKALDKSYRIRYGVSLIENSRMLKAQGSTAFQAEQQKKYTCTSCGGTISLHDGNCSCCKAEYLLGRRSCAK